MNASEFSRIWHGAPMVKFALSTASAQGLSADSRESIGRFGLPKTAEPWLNFMEFVLMEENTAAQMEKLNFYPIGYLANGDIICIDKSSDRIMICDHEDMTYVWVLNSSLNTLYESIKIFEEFTEQVNTRNPNFSSDFKIPDGMLADLESRLRACDRAAYDEKGFWFTEIQALDDSAW